MKGNLKNQQHHAQQTNSGYPAAPNQYVSQVPVGSMGPNKSNLNRLAFTANNFYDSRNMLSGAQQYGMRPSIDGQGGANQASGNIGQGGVGQAMSR